MEQAVHGAHSIEGAFGEIKVEGIHSVRFQSFLPTLLHHRRREDRADDIRSAVLEELAMHSSTCPDLQQLLVGLPLEQGQELLSLPQLPGGDLATIAFLHLAVA